MMSPEPKKCYQPEDLGVEGSAQPFLQSYPTTQIGKRLRKFQSSWFAGRPWLEYSIKADACFCYPCRKFVNNLIRDRDQAFTQAGFSNWKIALEKSRGFQAHEQSKCHIDSMKSWTEYQNRTNSGKTIAMQLSSDNIARNRYYIKNIAETVVFLALNELGFRGDNENVDKVPEDHCNDNIGGLFLRLFEFAMKKDDKLRQIAQTMPQNAKYTSPEIQNEVIDCLRDMVQQKIVEEFNSSDINMFCLKCDETRDSCNIENLSIVVRFVKSGKAIEHLLSMSRLVAMDAESITSKILDELHHHNIDPLKILSQCFDGAAVMSGRFGGVQKVLQKRLQRDIPYIHCMNHQIHLVVIHCMQRVPKAKRFFALCEQLYVFFRRQFVANLYNGKTMKRLLEQRWTGHLETAKVVSENHQEILEALLVAADSNSVEQSLSTEAAGLHTHVAKAEFVFMAAVVVKVLSILQPSNAQLQGKSCNMSDAIHLINAAINSLELLRNDESFNEFAQTSGTIF